MTGVLLVAAGSGPGPGAALRSAGAVSVEVVPVPVPAGRDVLDPVLDRLDGRLLVVAGPVAAVGDVVVRLLRRDALDVPVAVLPAADPLSRSFAAGLGVPADPAGAAAVALRGRAQAVDLVRDDAGQVVLWAAALSAAPHGHRPRRAPLRGYVDEHRMADGRPLSRDVVGNAGGGPRRAPADPTDGRLDVWLVPGGWWRRPWHRRGRATEVSGEQWWLTVDGREHPRPVRRRAWWVEPGRLRLVLPA